MERFRRLGALAYAADQSHAVVCPCHGGDVGMVPLVRSLRFSR
jgi:hypothetical protein